MSEPFTKARFIGHPTYTYPKFENVNDKPELLHNKREVDIPERNDVCTFVRTLEVKKPLETAVITITALGIYEVYINGARVCEDELKPGHTDYRIRVYADSFDITSAISEGDVRLAVEVSRGWHAGRISFGAYKYAPPALICELKLTYTDGSEEIIATDEAWRVTLDGCYVTADIWDGIYYDATRDDPRVSDIGCSFEYAVKCDDISAKPEMRLGPPVVVKPELEMAALSAMVYSGAVDDGSEFGRIFIHNRRIGDGCEAVTIDPEQTLLLDFGQNMVGRPRIKMIAPRGAKIRVNFAEMLNDSGDPERGCDGPAGSAYIDNYRSAMSRVLYVAPGRMFEFTPRHTFYGFRYVEITSDLGGKVVEVAGEVVGSELCETASFECSSGEVNKLFSNILWGARGNYLSIPTDCPQRDERLGWTGDTQAFCGAGSYLFDLDPFMRKWLCDLRDTQLDSGDGYKDVAPNVFVGSTGAHAGWGDAGIIVPYYMYKMYGDLELVETHYDSMERYMKYIGGVGGPQPLYGDWLNYEITDKQYIADCYYIYDAHLMSYYSSLMGKADREAFYLELEADLKAKYAEKYIAGDDLTERTQCSYLMALRFGCIPDSMRASLTEKLKNKIIENNYTLSTGFLGTSMLTQTLSELGLHDLAYSLLLQTADPSWLYSVRQGATTVWERWNSYTVKNGFGDVRMNSFNHYAYGAVAEWMMNSMAGIAPKGDGCGFERFTLRPTPDMREFIPEGQERITFVRASYDSSAGRIESAWEYIGGEYVYSFKIPKGTTAKVELPVVSGDRVEINGLVYELYQLGGRIEEGKRIFTLGAGEYRIR